MTKWQIVYEGAPTPAVQFGLEALSAAVREYALYWPGVGPENEAMSGIRLSLAGPNGGVPFGVLVLEAWLEEHLKCKSGHLFCESLELRV